MLHIVAVVADDERFGTLVPRSRDEGIAVFHRLVGVALEGEKVRQTVMFLAEFDEIADQVAVPQRTGEAARTAECKRRIDTLDGTAGRRVKVVIIGFGQYAEPQLLFRIQLDRGEFPLTHFFHAVAFDKVTQCCLHQCDPLFAVVVDRRKGIVFPHVFFVARKCRRHKAQFEEGMQSNAQQEVEQHIGVEKIVDRLFVCVLLVDVHIAVENAVKTDVTESNLTLSGTNLFLYRRKQSAAGIADVEQIAPCGPDGFGMAGGQVKRDLLFFAFLLLFEEGRADVLHEP